MNDVTPTHSAYLELLEERQGMGEGYQFLDEKRLVLAAEILQQLSRFEQTLPGFQSAYHRAGEALQAALSRHGLDGLEVYPRAEFVVTDRELSRRSVLGVQLQDIRWALGGQEVPPAVNRTFEADLCRDLFGRLVPEMVALASMTRNLERLREEYRRTARRARALEDVLLPEIDETLSKLDSGLEELEREEVIRVRWSTRD